MAQAIITGPTKWFKAIGEARPNKFKNNELEWSFQIGVGSAEKLLFRQNKVKKHVKFDEELGDYVQIELPVLGKKGVPNRPIKVVDPDGNEWPSDKWIGNGSTIKATIDLDKYSFTKDGEKIEGCKLIPRTIVIVDYKPYESSKGTSAKTEKRTDSNDWNDGDE